MKKEWIAQFQGHRIRVTNAWFGGAKLFIDDECRAKNYKLVADPRFPALSANIIAGKTDSPLVEVFVEAVITVKARICVDGTRIAGDLAG